MISATMIPSDFTFPKNQLLNLFRFHRELDKAETFNLSIAHDFLGIYINLESPLEYCGNQLLPGIIGKGQYNLIYLPANEYEATIPRGVHKSIAISIAPDTLVKYSPDFPFLINFLGSIKNKKPLFIREKHLFITPKMDIEVNSVSANIFKGEDLKKLFTEIKAFDLCFEALLDIGDLCKITDCLTSINSKTIENISAYLLKNIDQNISISDLSDRFGITARRLQQGFKSLFGKNVHEYVVQNRLDRAKKMLRDSNISIKSVALAIGYKDVQNFSAAYKKRYNQSPSAFRMTEPC